MSETSTASAPVAPVPAAPVSAAPAAPVPIKRRLLDSDFAVSSFRYNRWSAILKEDQTIADALSPAFWTNQADKIMGHDKANPRGLLDIIEVRKPDAGAYYELIITEIGLGFVRVAPVRAYEPPAIALADDSPLTTKWNVGKRCHDVVRKSDNTVMKPGFQTKASAAAWIAEHVKAMAA